MAKKKKKKDSHASKAVESFTPPVVENTPPVVEKPEPKPEAAAPAKKVAKTSSGEFPAFKGGGYNDFVNWKKQKKAWEAKNG